MSDAFYIAATGMQAQQRNLDTIANNLANVNTMGFKKGRVNFSDLVVKSGAPDPVASADPAAGLLAPASSVAAGVGIAGVDRVFDGGDLRSTGSPFDLALQGDGFIEVSLPDGSSAYTRGGTLKVNRDGLLCNEAGLPLKPGITIADGAQGLRIDADGRVSFSLAGQDGVVEAGQIQLVRFANASGLNAEGDKIFRASEASGEPIAARAGQDGIGSLVQGAVESSNVKPIDEMMNMMIAQRGYEASLKVVQAADEMAGMVNSMRR